MKQKDMKEIARNRAKAERMWKEYTKKQPQTEGEGASMEDGRHN